MRAKSSARLARSSCRCCASWPLRAAESPWGVAGSGSGHSIGYRVALRETVSFHRRPVVGWLS
jgi:hypothetical protein